MSRKDPRRCLLVPLDDATLTTLRRIARGRSLGNALRRCVEQSLDQDALDLEASCLGPVPLLPVRLLPVQLPRKTRQQVDHLAKTWDVSAAYVVVQLVASRQGAADFDPKD